MQQNLRQHITVLHSHFQKFHKPKRANVNTYPIPGKWYTLQPRDVHKRAFLSCLQILCNEKWWYVKMLHKQKVLINLAESGFNLSNILDKLD